MKSGFASILCIFALLFSLDQAALATDAAVPYPELVFDDARQVLTSPSRWKQQDWQNLGLATLAVVATAAIVDRPLRDEMNRRSGSSVFMGEVERFGAEYSLGVLGGFYLAGTAGKNDKAIAVARDGLAACLITSGIVVPTLKLAFGRSRPRDNSSINHLKPFSYGNSSFPSGHSAQAFTLATVIARHYDESWVGRTAYATAGLVGVARSYHGAHYASDILASALIGIVIGRSVVEHNQQHRAGTVALVPEASPGLVSLSLRGTL